MQILYWHVLSFSLSFYLAVECWVVGEPYVYLKWHCQRVSPSAFTTMRIPVAPHPCPHLILSDFNLKHSSEISSWFYFAFPSWCWAFFPVLPCHLPIFFGEMPVQVFHPVVVVVLRLLVFLNFESSLHVLDKSVLLGVGFLNVFF